MSPGGLSDAERIDRVFLSRVIEPGDELGGRWLRGVGVRETVRRLTGGGPPLPGASQKRWAGLRARAESADPQRDLALARDAGARFVRGFGGVPIPYSVVRKTASSGFRAERTVKRAALAAAARVKRR